MVTMYIGIECTHAFVLYNIQTRKNSHVQCTSYTNSRKDAYKLCKSSYKYTQIHLYAYKNT